MYKYKVIWFDDEHESLNIIREKAFIEDIELIGFSNAKEGIEELERNIKNYDAAILDGLFYTTAEQSGIASTDKAFFNVAITLEKLVTVKNLPWFILSGQLGFTKEKNRYAEGLKDNQVYDKLNDLHLAKLWYDIKTEAAKQEETQLRLDHSEIFSIFNLGYLKSETEQQVLELLNAKLSDNKVEMKSILVNIRSIMESCFNSLELISVIPNANESFNNKMRYLSGSKEKGIDGKFNSRTKEYQNDAIENLNKWLYFTCGKYIHNLKDENYNDYHISKYAIESLRQGLLEFLLWFKKTYEENK